MSSVSMMFLGAIMSALMLSTLAHYTAFGQFSVPLEEPTEPATTTTVGENNTTATTEEAVAQTIEIGGLTYYTDTQNGFRVQIPEGWIAHNSSSAQPGLDEDRRLNVINALGGLDTIAYLCPQTMALPVIGGGFECGYTPDPIMIDISKYYFNLPSNQEFADILQAGGNITTHDLLAHTMQRAVTAGRNVEIVNETDMTTNLIDPATNRIVASDIPVKVVEYTYTIGSELIGDLRNVVKLVLLAVHNEPEGNEARAYKIDVWMDEEGTTDVETAPPGTMITIPEVSQVFGSFEVLSTTATTNNRN